MNTLTCIDLGSAPYAPVVELQEHLVERIRTGDATEAFLIFVEHSPPVVTFGRQVRPEHLIGSPEALDARNIELHETRRGGDVTFHGPGQLVGYPIMHLDHHGRDVHEYLRNIEEVLIRTLKRFDIDAGRVKGLTGVWVGDEKVAAIGIALRRWICYHGFALNVTCDLSQFDLIVPCGIADKTVTSVAGILKRDINVDQVKPVVLDAMLDVFGFDDVTYERRTID